MARYKRSFVLYADLLSSVDHLTDEELGKLFKHILLYVNDQDPVLEDRLLLTAWKPIQRFLKEDLKKWEDKRQVRAEAGRKGGLQKQANLAKGSKSKQKVANVAVSDSVSVSVSDSVSVINNNSNSNELPQPDAFDSYIKTWTQATGRTIKSKRSEVAKTAIKHFNARIREGYTLEEITTAINNAASDPHHSESGYKWLTLDFILRPQQLERWREDNREQRKEADMISQVAAIAERIEKERQLNTNT